MVTYATTDADFGKDISSWPSSVESDGIRTLGLPVSALTTIETSFPLTRAAVANVLWLSPATLARRRRAGLLKPAEADRLLRLARVLAHALRVFEEPARVVRWLQGEVPALGDRKPIELLDTDAGTSAVDAVLTRLEHGVVA
ncbi:MAG: antitoxin Xre/MbcA/ParS toxin-binding domain-containing protein [Dehalococcoidia bacterium]